MAVLRLTVNPFETLLKAAAWINLPLLSIWSGLKPIVIHSKIFFCGKRLCNREALGTTVCHKIWGGGLIFAFFAIFPAIPKNKFPQTFFPQKFTPEKIFSNLNSLHKNTVLRNRACSITTCLFHSETKRCTMNYWYYIGFAYGIVLFENMYFYCTYLAKTKILPMLGTGYFLKISKINSQQEKPICPNRKN